MEWLGGKEGLKGGGVECLGDWVSVTADLWGGLMMDGEGVGGS